MSDFWAGVASAMIGAVVGGIFTAIGVRAQIKAAVQSAHMQVSAMAQQQVEATRLAMKQRAVVDIERVLGKILSAAYDAGVSHVQEMHRDEGLRPRKPHEPSEELLIQAVGWQREVDKLLFLYDMYLTPEAVRSIEALLAVLPDEPSLAQLEPFGGNGCLEERWLDEVQTVLMHAIEEVSYFAGLTEKVPFHIKLKNPDFVTAFLAAVKRSTNES